MVDDAKRNFLKGMLGTVAGATMGSDTNPAIKKADAHKVRELLSKFRYLQSDSQRTITDFNKGFGSACDARLWDYTRLDGKAIVTDNDMYDWAQNKLSKITDTKEYEATVKELAEALGGDSVILPDNSYSLTALDQPELHSIADRGVINANSVMKGTQAHLAKVNSFPEEVKNRLPNVISRMKNKHAIHERMRQALLDKGVPENELSTSMFKMTKLGCPEETSRIDYFNNDENFERELEAIVQERNQHRDSAQYGLDIKRQMAADTLEEKLGLPFGYEHGAYYAGMPLQNDEILEHIYQGLAVIAEASGCTLPPKEDVFINERLLNHAGEIVSAPTGVPVPRLFEIRLPVDLAENLAEMSKGNFQKGFFERERLSEISDALQQIASAFSSIDKLRNGTWVNVTYRPKFNDSVDAPQRA